MSDHDESTTVAELEEMPPVAFPDALPSLTASRVLDSIARLRLVALPISAVADDLRVKPDDLTTFLEELTDGNLAYTWEWYDEEKYWATETLRRDAHGVGDAAEDEAFDSRIAEIQAIREAGRNATPDPDTMSSFDMPRPAEYIPADPVHVLIVTLTEAEADRRGLRFNASGRRWVAKNAPEPSDRLRPGPAIRATDMGEDPPGTLDNYPTHDPAATESARRADQAAGIVRPRIVITGLMNWALPGQDRGPWAPDPVGPKGIRKAVVVTPGTEGDGPTSTTIDDPADAWAAKRGRTTMDRPKGHPCEACGSPKEYRDGKMLRVGGNPKNPADYEQVSCPEECAACGKGAQDAVIERARWPRGRPGAKAGRAGMRSGKTNHGKKGAVA